MEGELDVPCTLWRAVLTATHSNSETHRTATTPSLGLRPFVVVCDSRPNRAQEISRVVREAGGEPLVIETKSAVARIKCSPMQCLAVVAAGAPAACPEMHALHQLKQKGFKIIAYEDGAKSWSLRLKCLPLLAGAVQVLDSTAGEFGRKLHDHLEEMLYLEAKNQDEAQRIKSVMQGLGMVGESASMMDVFRSVIRFSVLSDLPVLITGETGTGKEGIAHALHRLDPKRGNGPFVAVNCGAIAASLAESEFFGHRRGAFTGANRDRKGLIRSANGGVLFLDEIGELDPPVQGKLLRVLQEKRLLAVGEDRDIEVCVRVVAATNRDLAPTAQQSGFREDLFHRLNVLSIQVPPLRERHDDIGPLTEHFLQKYRSLTHGTGAEVGPEFLDALRLARLPGNVRQLENLVRQALLWRRTDAPLGLHDLPVDVWRQLSEPVEDLGAWQTETKRPPELKAGELAPHIKFVLEANDWNLARSLGDCERQALEAAMTRTRGNQSEVARLLGITPRSVYNKSTNTG